MSSNPYLLGETIAVCRIAPPHPQFLAQGRQAKAPSGGRREHPSAAAGVIAPIAAVYTYSRSEGLFAGASLDGAVIASRPGANADYYGHAVRVRSILLGRVRPPAGATRLMASL